VAEAGKAGRLHRLRLRRRRKIQAATMTIVDHLSELRRRIVVSLVVFLALSAAAFAFYEPIQEFLRRPYCEVDPRLLSELSGCDLVITKPLGGFNFRLKLTAMVGLALASPVWLYQLYAFIVPALTSKEKRYSIPFLVSSVTLFVVGATFAYLTLPTGLNFLMTLGGPDVEPLLGAEEYLNFVGLLLIAFGVTFELPLLLFFLGLVGAVSVETLRSQRKVAFVIIVALSAVVTPSQDPYTMSIMAVPLYGLYELTILILSRVMKRRAERDAVSEA
jgi:sec-independent protein translocase protein TatC